MSAIHEQNCRVWSGYDCTCSITNQQLMVAEERIRVLEQEENASIVNLQAQLQAVTKLYDGSQEHIEQLANQLQAARQERDEYRAWAKKCTDASSERAQLQAHNRELIAALEPFLEEHCCDDGSADFDGTMRECGVCSPARAALSRIPKEPTE